MATEIMRPSSNENVVWDWHSNWPSANYDGDSDNFYDTKSEPIHNWIRDGF